MIKKTYNQTHDELQYWQFSDGFVINCFKSEIETARYNQVRQNIITQTTKEAYLKQMENVVPSRYGVI